ncbi:MAG: hypothetical protein NZ922_01050 [Candidatus Methanomethyliaceae archaeon]|nr:hypothetical protein [Candidatus Methanomethyliaceae archaeon]MDW7970238.1 hypothetical protein [Nitrososphaerota archaeon]
MLIEEILMYIEKNGLDEFIKKRLEEHYGAKYIKAMEALESFSVKKYVFLPSNRVVWIVVGKKREYFVIPRIYCQCNEFYINVVIKRKSDLCYHILAQAIAERIGKYETYKVSDSDFIRLNTEWKREEVED